MKPKTDTATMARKAALVLPTYNERENMQALIPAVYALLPELTIYVVDDNSPDGTALAVLELQQSYPNLRLVRRAKKDGLGRAYLHGFKEALKDPAVEAIFMMDGDLSHDPAHMPEMLALQSTHDLVIGSRYISTGRTLGWELWRRLLSRYGNVYARTILGVPYRDCTSGYNCIRASLLRSLDFNRLNLSGYAFIMHLKYLLHSAGARTLEIPITYKNRTVGKSKISNHIIAEGIIAPWKMLFGRNA